jgi:hypothetical protein
MAVSQRSSSSTPVSQPNDKAQTARKRAAAVPVDWKLTQQQQDFIDSFNSDNDKKS